MSHQISEVSVAAQTLDHKRINRTQCESNVSCTSKTHSSFGSERIVSRGIFNGSIPGNLSEGESAVEGDKLDPCTVSASMSSLIQQTDTTTVEDTYGRENLDDDDDEDDSDWVPSKTTAVIKKWFCTNCTMPNFENALRCNGCGECKESGTFTSHLMEEAFTHFESKVTDSFEGHFHHIQCSLNDVKSVLVQSLLNLLSNEPKVVQFHDHLIHRESCTKEATFGNGTAIGFDERMLLHSEVEMKSHPHPERPDRLRAIMANLAASGIFPGKCFRIPPRQITREELRVVHSLEHIDAVESTSFMPCSYFTPDTYANEHSALAAKLAAGFCADLATTIMSGRAKNGFALVRPPGHHAGTKQAMGFCLHNNAAAAAFAAQSASAKKVLIVDWDVHHGNGTQEIFEGNKSVLYISLHRHDAGLFYPGSGAASEVGIMGAEGYSVNVPWKRGGVGDNDYIFAFQNVVLPIALEFDPDITIISAGFDAAKGDPLGGCNVSPAGFAQMTHMLNGLSKGKLLVILEGGYNLHSISSSAVAVIKVLLGEDLGCIDNNVLPSKDGLQTVLEVLQIQLKYWPILESTFIRLLSQWKSLSSAIRKRRAKKRSRVFMPMWWKWGRKRSMYHLLFRGRHQLKVKMHNK